ncbi:MAG: acetoacetate decarboxylase family protein [Polyangiales bacterium]
MQKTLVLPILTALLSACALGTADGDSQHTAANLGPSPYRASVVRARHPGPSPMDDSSPLWTQVKKLSGGDFGVRIENVKTGEARYVRSPFRTESDASIFYFRVPYQVAVDYLGPREDEQGNELFPPILRVVDETSDQNWAVGAIWFVDYHRTDLGTAGNGSNGEYHEVVLTLQAAEPNGASSVTDEGPMSAAAIALCGRFPTITARLVLDNDWAIAFGREFLGFDKYRGDVTFKDGSVSATIDGESAIRAVKLPKPSAFDTSDAQLQLLFRITDYGGVDTGLAMLKKNAQRIAREGLIASTLSPLKNSARDWRDSLAPDIQTGAGTLAGFGFPAMPRISNVYYDFYVSTSSSTRKINKAYLKTAAADDDPHFGILAHAEVEAFFRAPNMRVAFGLSPEGKAQIDTLLK